MSEAERERYVAWWLYESGLDVDELIEIATMLVDLRVPNPCPNVREPFRMT